MNKSFFALLLFSQTTLSIAGEVKGSGELGATIASGNTDISTVNAKLALEYEINKSWSSTAKFDALSSSSAGTQSAEKYEFDYQTDYKKSDDLYNFVTLNLRTDRFGGVKLSTGVTGGIGYNFSKTEKTTLSTQAGAGFRNVTDTSDVDTSEAVITASLNYVNKLSGTTKVTTDLSLESGGSNSLIKADIGVEVKLGSDLSFKYTLGTTTNTTVGAGIDKTDVLQTANLVYGF